MNGSRPIVWSIAISSFLISSVALCRPPDDGLSGVSRRDGTARQEAPGQTSILAELADTAGVPQIAECEGLLTRETYESLKGQLTDPMEVPKAWKREGVMMPTLPLFTCLHNAWVQVNGIRESEGAAESFPEPWENEEFSLFFGPALVGATIPLPWTGDRTTSGFQKWQNEPSIAIDPTSTARLIAASNTGYKDPATACVSPMLGQTVASLALYATSNGDQPPQTARWTYACAPWPTGIVPVCGTQCSYSFGDPSVAWDSNGNGYACYLLIANCLGCTYPTFANSVGVAKYNPATNTWAPLGYVANRFADNTSRPDKPFMHIDTSPSSPYKNRIYVTWAEAYGAGGFTQANQYLAYSSDGGSTWTTKTLDSPGANVKVNGGNITTDKNGVVYALWQRWTGDAPEASVLAKSTNGGQTWPAGSVIYTHNDNMGSCYIRPENVRGINAFGMLDSDVNPVSPYSGRLYFVANDIAAGFQCSDPTCNVGQALGSVNVLLFYSDNQGQTWTQTGGGSVNQPPDASGTVAYHFLPWMSVDQSDGTVNVIWYDTRGFSSNNYSTQMFYARSSNGGQSFEPNILLTDAGANWQNQPGYSSENTCLNHHGPQLPDQEGEYIGTAAANRKVYYVATDTRQFWDALDSTLKEDISTAFVTNCSPPVWDALAPSVTCEPVAGGLSLSWHAATSPGTGASSVAYHVYRSTSSSCAGGVEVTPPAGVSGTSFTDSTGTAGTVYYYNVVAKNDCPGTTLTPMSLTSACSLGKTFPSSIDPTIYSPTSSVCTSSSGNKASASLAPGGATYAWTIANGTITGGSTSQVVTYSANSTGSVTLTVVVSKFGCSRTGSLVIPISQNLVSNSIATTGSTTVCLNGSGGTATVTDSANGGAIKHQWGFRTVSGGTITPMASRTATTYLINAADFAASPGTYYLVCTSTPQCGTSKVSNEQPVTVTSQLGPGTPVITAPFSAAPGATGQIASAPTVGVYTWTMTGGTITAGQGTKSITFTAGSAGTTINMLATLNSGINSCVSPAGTAVTQVDFLDVPFGNPYHDAVDIIAKNGISSGCGGGNFCPDNSVDRQTASVLLLRSEHGGTYQPPACTPTFSDVPCPSQYADWIGQLALENITSGCGGGNFCPTFVVDRQTVAVLLLKTRFGAGYTPPACTGIFTDVPCPNGFAVNWIEDLYNRGITGGCAPSLYCPTNPVTRAQMAVFLKNTFGLQ